VIKKSYKKELTQNLSALLSGLVYTRFYEESLKDDLSLDVQVKYRKADFIDNT
jgi:hypothetical protein